MTGKEVDLINQGDSGFINDSGSKGENVKFNLTSREIKNIDETYGDPLDWDNLPEGITLIPNEELPNGLGLEFTRSHGRVPRKGY